MLYRRTQIGGLTAGVPLFVGLGMMVVLWRSDAPGIATFVATFTALVLLLFGALTVTVDSGSIRVVFGIGRRGSRRRYQGLGTVSQGILGQRQQRDTRRGGRQDARAR